jgi:hypothetical protein
MDDGTDVATVVGETVEKGARADEEYVGSVVAAVLAVAIAGVSME